MDIPVYLIHSGPPGTETIFKLPRRKDTYTIYLPDSWSGSPNISEQKDNTHSHVRLDITELHALLSVYENDAGPVLVISEEMEMTMPLSTLAHQKSIILTEVQDFKTSSGYWRLEWDETGSTSNLIGAPLLPIEGDMETDNEEKYMQPIMELVLAGDGCALIDQEDLEDLSDDELHQPAPVAEIHLSPTSPRRSESAEQADLIAPASPEPILQTIMIEDEVGSDIQKPDDVVVETMPIMECVEATVGTTVAADSQKPESTIGCTSDSSSKQCIESDGDFASENSSQLQKDDTRPKRRLCEIELEDNASVNKKQKTAEVLTVEQLLADATTVLPSIKYKAISTTPAINTQPVTVVKLSDVSPEMIYENEDDHIPTVRVEKKGSKRVATANSTPARASSRSKSDTPKTVSAYSLATYDHRKPRVVFGSTSTIPQNKALMSMIGKLGGTVVDDIDHADVLCIGKGHIKKTSKFIIAVAKGKDIVTDDWLKEAYSVQRLPRCQLFLPYDKRSEEEWGFSLSEAIQRGKNGLRLLEGIDVYLTAQLRKDLGKLTRELKQVAKAMGAAHVHPRLPQTGVTKHVLVVGSTQNSDPQAAKVSRLGHKLYSQDVLTMAALRGRLELQSDEFLLGVTA